ncbi:MAG: sodium/proline symporter [Candidatus Marinimicrobia bacterium]|nr:sodium/proline symporter [Candidatus Neomarinimicrobiota bacterium]
MDPIFIGIFLYLAILLLIGIKSIRKNKTHADYLLADRQLGSWAISLSERASGESAWLLLGLPGAALMTGMAELWVVIGCLAGIIISWMYLAKPLRDLAGRYDALTVPDLIASYFEDAKTLRLIASLIITFFFTFYVAAQFSGAGKVLSITFGMPHETGMFIGAGVILLYTILGGFNAVVWTDVIQALIMILVLVLLPVIGLIEVMNTDPALLYQYSKEMLSPVGAHTGIAGLLAIVSGLSWAFGYMGQPHLIIRYMAIRDSVEIQKSRIIAYCWAIPAFIGAFFMGLMAYKLYGQGIVSDPEQIMPYMAKALLPAWFAGILISGAMAAMMSTADSQLLVTASAISEDIIHNVANKKLSPEKMLTTSRLITLAVGILAFIMAWFSTDLIFKLVSYAWSGLGASFGPVLICMIYWKKITREGAIAGMLTGAVTTIVWKNIDFLQAIIAERFVSFALAFLAIVMVSQLKKK